jgi:hypothetical protein
MEKSVQIWKFPATWEILSRADKPSVEGKHWTNCWKILHVIRTKLNTNYNSQINKFHFNMERDNNFRPRSSMSFIVWSTSSKVWFTFFNSVIPHLQQCGPTSSTVWSHIFNSVVPLLQQCGPTSSTVWSHIFNSVIPHLQQCGPTASSDTWHVKNDILCNISLSRTRTTRDILPPMFGRDTPMCGVTGWVHGFPAFNCHIFHEN